MGYLRPNLPQNPTVEKAYRAMIAQRQHRQPEPAPRKVLGKKDDG